MPDVRVSVLANRTAAPSPVFFVILGHRFPTASSPVMLDVFRVVRTMAGCTIPHEHACPCGCFEYIIYSFYLQGRAFFIGPGADDVSHTLALFTGDPRLRIVGIVRLFIRRSQVGFATDEDDWDLAATDTADFLDPLYLPIRTR